MDRGFPQALVAAKKTADEAWSRVQEIMHANVSDMSDEERAILAIQLDIAKRRFGKANIAYDDALSAYLRSEAI